MDPEAAQPLILLADALQTRPLTQIPSQIDQQGVSWSEKKPAMSQGKRPSQSRARHPFTQSTNSPHSHVMDI